MGTSANPGNDSGVTPNPSANGGDQGRGTGAQPAGGGEQNPQIQGANGLNRERLSPLLRGMSEEQLNETFESLFAAMRQPQSQQPRNEAPPEPKRPPTKEELRNKFDPTSDEFDPAGAIAEITQTNYGPLIDDIGRRANAGMRESLRRQLPDFDKHEADINRVLANVPPNQITEQVLAQTYFSVLGAKEANRIQQERQKPPTTTTPSTKKEEQERPKLSSEEEQVARVMFRGSDDPIKAYLDAQEKMDKGYTMKVPGDK